MLASSYTLRSFRPGERFGIGPFAVETWQLPHFVPNAGLRLTAGGAVLAYTGDTGPSPDIIRLARGADLFLSEATYLHTVPDPNDAPYLLTARGAGQYAARAQAGRLLLTHLWPGTDENAALKAAAEAYDGPVAVATTGDILDVAGS
ncbi:MBL fold metallo-hydrolase [Streptomyces sp. NPDC046716]|uniref:MBL fold metallo-hydrolase n=1 Tax=Streptomyces sp. NPDC046716 TaxID=3157093 RepID=UPI0033C3EC51